MAYFIALLASIPFMDPGIIYEGIISKLYLGGVDIIAINTPAISAQTVAISPRR